MQCNQLINPSINMEKKKKHPTPFPYKNNSECSCSILNHSATYSPPNPLMDPKSPCHLKGCVRQWTVHSAWSLCWDAAPDPASESRGNGGSRYVRIPDRVVWTFGGLMRGMSLGMGRLVILDWLMVSLVKRVCVCGEEGANTSPAGKHLFVINISLNPSH